MTEEETNHLNQTVQLNNQHDELLSKLIADHKKEIEEKEEQKKNLQEELNKMEHDNKIRRDSKENEEWERIDYIKEKNKADLYKAT